MDTLALRIEHKAVEPTPEPAPTGQVTIERGGGRALLLVPETLDRSRRYPLVTVLHGAGRQDELLARACDGEPERRKALFLIPRSLHPTWDLIAAQDRPDLDFLEYAYDLIYRRYPIDPARQALLGYSDGASYGLSIGLSNPRIFRAVMGWSAGFIMVDPTFNADADPKPAIYLEHGTHDPVFPFQHVALPLRAALEKAGYDVTYSVDEGGKHWPSRDFQAEALDWFFSGPGAPDGE